MTPKNTQPETPRETESTLHEQLAEITETMQREKILLSPEMKKYFNDELGKLNNKLANGEPVYAKDMEFINKIKSWVEAERFITVQMSKSHDEMADTLQNYGYTDKIPDKQTVMEAIRNLSPEMIENIRKFNRPTILMTPEVTLKEMRKKLDNNKKYPDQENTYFEEKTGDALWNPEATKFTVSIVDGVPEMPQLPADKVNLKNEEKLKYLTEEYKKQGMKMISAREYAMLAQRSLRTYEQIQNEDELIDKNTPTLLNADHLTDLEKVPVARWFSAARGFRFRWDSPGSQLDLLRGRPSVQVL